MKFLVLQHINIEHPGIFLKFMKEDNIKIDTIELDENEKIPSLEKYDAMIVMGGPMDTWQEEAFPWLKMEMRFDFHCPVRFLLVRCLFWDLILSVELYILFHFEG